MKSYSGVGKLIKQSSKNKRNTGRILLAVSTPTCEEADNQPDDHDGGGTY